MLRLGKDGWQAVISEEFTFENVGKIATAVAVYLINRRLIEKPIIVSYDARFLSDIFAGKIVKIMEGTGASIILTERDTPVPVIEWELTDRDTCGALMVTAGGQPAQYSGVKFFTGAIPAARDNMTDIDRYIFLSSIKQTHSNPEPDLLAYQAGLSQMGVEMAARSRIERIDPRARYLTYLGAQIDGAAVKKAKFKIIIDPLFGSARGYFDLFLQQLGCEVEEINDHRDVLFGGLTPDPKEENLAMLKARVAESGAQLGLAFNGDGSDYAVVDQAGKYYPSGQFAEKVRTSDAFLAAARVIELAALKGLKALG